MRERIWAELTQTKHDTEYLGLYSDRQRVVLRWFNIGILTFSTGGVMGWTIWDKFPVVVCTIIAIVSLLRLLQPHIIMTEKMLNNLDIAIADEVGPENGLVPEIIINFDIVMS